VHDISALSAAHLLSCGDKFAVNKNSFQLSPIEPYTLTASWPADRMPNGLFGFFVRLHAETLSPHGSPTIFPRFLCLPPQSHWGPAKAPQEATLPAAVLRLRNEHIEIQSCRVPPPIALQEVPLLEAMWSSQTRRIDCRSRSSFPFFSA
jgi:hypothetical protein